jgi:hypothetical protein
MTYPTPKNPDWGLTLNDYIAALEDVARAAKELFAIADEPLGVSGFSELEAAEKKLREALDNVEVRNVIG